jgi:hypothetical protein
MWKANGKTTTLQLFLNSLSPKNMEDASSGDKLKIALFGELSLEEAMDLSRDRQILDLDLAKISGCLHEHTSISCISLGVLLLRRGRLYGVFLLEYVRHQNDP